MTVAPPPAVVRSCRRFGLMLQSALLPLSKVASVSLVEVVEEEARTEVEEETKQRATSAST